MSEKNRLIVKIGSREYTIISAADSDYMHKVASHVDKDMCDMMSANSRLNMDMAAVLVALNSVDCRFKMEIDLNLMKERLIQYEKASESVLSKVKILEAQINILKSEMDKKDQEISELNELLS